MDKSKVTPKDFFLWAGAFVALYVCVFNYIALVWDYINFAYPDPLNYYPSDPYQSGISWEMATLIVLTPLFLVLMHFIRSDIKRDASRRDTWIRKWVLYLTLFAAAVAIAVDFISILYSFLSGTELTIRFLLKALVVLVVAALGFLHFFVDLRGYWEKFPTRSRMMALATGLLVAITIVAGFFIVGTPAQARLYRLDIQKINDLTNIQFQVVNYWQQKESLPASLQDLRDPISGTILPHDPTTGDAYTYKRNGPLDFVLCATFATQQSVESMNDAQVHPVALPTDPTMIKGKTVEDNWQHAIGEVCFDRSIDPKRYPPYSKGI